MVESVDKAIHLLFKATLLVIFFLMCELELMKSTSNVVIIEQDKACTTLAYCMAYSQRSMDSRGFLEWITHLDSTR